MQGGLPVRTPWSLRPGQLLGSAFMEWPQGSPQPPAPAGCSAGTGLGCPRPPPTWTPPSRCPEVPGRGRRGQTVGFQPQLYHSMAHQPGAWEWVFSATSKMGGTVLTDFPGLLRRLSELLQIKPQGAVSVLGIISVVSIGVVSIQII